MPAMASVYPIPHQRGKRRNDLMRWMLRHCGMAAVTRDDPPPRFAAHGSDRVTTGGEGIEEFECFFRCYESLISGYLRRMIGDEQAVYDLSQETFFRAWQHFAEIK